METKSILNLINQDLQAHECGEIMEILNYHEETGLTVPFRWIEWIPELKEAWDRFMYGQTYCEHGFFVRDVVRFLRSKIRRKAGK